MRPDTSSRRWMRYLSLAVFGIANAMVVSITPTTVWAQADEITEEAEESRRAQEDERRWSIRAELGTIVGQGTFVEPRNNTEFQGQIDDGNDAYDRANLTLGVEPSYRLGDFTFSASAEWVQWLTPGGGTATSPYASNAVDAYEFRMLDTTLSASHVGWQIPGAKARFIPSADVGLPTSETSQTDSLVLDTGVGFTLVRPFFERITLAVQVQGSKSWHRRKTASVNVDQTDVVFRDGGAEDLGGGRVAIGGYNVEYSLASGLTMQAKLLDKLSASVYYGLSNFWTYNHGPRDDLSSPYAEAGRGFSQLAVGQLQLAYQINEYFSVSGGTLSIQPPKTADQESFRFPFWNFHGAGANYSAFQLAVEAQY